MKKEKREVKHPLSPPKHTAAPGDAAPGYPQCEVCSGGSATGGVKRGSLFVRKNNCIFRPWVYFLGCFYPFFSPSRSGYGVARTLSKGSDRQPPLHRPPHALKGQTHLSAPLRALPRTAAAPRCLGPRPTLGLRGGRTVPGVKTYRKVLIGERKWGGSAVIINS